MMSFKLRRLLPCWIGAVEYNVDLPDDDIIQVVMVHIQAAELIYILVVRYMPQSSTLAFNNPNSLCYPCFVGRGLSVVPLCCAPNPL